MPRWVHPAIGGAATGMLAVVGLEFFHLNGIAGDPYKTLTLALTGTLPVRHGGVLRAQAGRDSLFVFERRLGRHLCAVAVHGGMLGGAVGYLDVMVFHHSADSIGAFAVVGMGAVFAGIVRAPMTSVLIVFEMTGGYGLVLPLMIANMSAFALARLLAHVPVYEALLAQDGIYLPERTRPLHSAEETPVQTISVAGAGGS